MAKTSDRNNENNVDLSWMLLHTNSTGVGQIARKLDNDTSYLKTLYDIITDIMNYERGKENYCILFVPRYGNEISVLIGSGGKTFTPDKIESIRSKITTELYERHEPDGLDQFISKVNIDVDKYITMQNFFRYVNLYSNNKEIDVDEKLYKYVQDFADVFSRRNQNIQKITEILTKITLPHNMNDGNDGYDGVSEYLQDLNREIMDIKEVADFFRYTIDGKYEYFSGDEVISLIEAIKEYIFEDW